METICLNQHIFVHSVDNKSESTFILSTENLGYAANFLFTFYYLSLIYFKMTTNVFYLCYRVFPNFTQIPQGKNLFPS